MHHRWSLGLVWVGIVRTTTGSHSRAGSLVPEEDAIVNSVAVRDGVVAAAVEAPVKTNDGWVVFFDVDGAVLNALRVGALPDMVTFTPNGRTLLVANEGEPAEDYGVDPPGTVSVIDVSGPITDLDQSSVRPADFTAWDPGGSRDLDADVRVLGPEEESLPSESLEPEYIVADTDDRSPTWRSRRTTRSRSWTSTPQRSRTCGRWASRTTSSPATRWT